MIWRPNVVVAAIVERNGRYLLVEEETDEGIRFNQPAGHLEYGESLVDAAIRETLEETAYRFEPRTLVGVYRLCYPATRKTYLRFAFAGEVSDHDSSRRLDDGILRADWFRVDEVRQMGDRLRSPLVLRCIEDHMAGRVWPLEILHDWTH